MRLEKYEERKKEAKVVQRPEPSMDDMQLTTGLADDFDGTIVDAKFDVNPDYERVAGAADPMLILTLECPEFGEPVTQGWSTGGAPKWEIGRGGLEITSSVNPDLRRFNMNTRAGELVKRMFKLVGQGNEKAGQEVFLVKKHYMTEAEFYSGLSFHWKREPMRTVSGEARDVLMPNTYLGESAGSGAKASAPTAVAEGDIDRLIAVAIGKDEMEVKQASLKDEVLSKNSALMHEVFNKGLLGTLVKDGKLKVGDDGKYSV